MGLLEMLSKALGFSRREARILVVGLDNCGKTTLVHKINPRMAGTTANVAPTVGFRQEEFVRNNINFTIFDMSGQGKYRSLWEQYYKDVEAVIYVLDSSDRMRACVSKEELAQLLGHADIQGRKVPILFFANKMDIPGAMTPEMVADELELEKVRDKPWHIQSSNALKGDGVDEGIEWLCTQLTMLARK